MLAAVGHPVTRLHRSGYAGLTLEGLEPAQWRELEPFEVAGLRDAGGVDVPPRFSGRGSSA
jgi:23S rRNA pseudouridine2605 synthase